MPRSDPQPFGNVLACRGYHTVGIDIAPDMVAQARRLDPAGDLTGFAAGTFDLVLPAFTFDNVPTMETKVTLFRALRSLLSATGRIVNLVSRSTRPTC